MEWRLNMRSVKAAKPIFEKILRVAVARFIIWLTIPLRIFREISDWYNPPSSSHDVKVGGGSHSNGMDHSVDKAQEQLWRQQADHDEWWTPGSTMSTLKLFNPLRVRLIAEAYLKETMGLENSWEQAFNRDERPLSGSRICDVGCGGGILSEALAEAGASVVGVDMMAPAIGIAKRHWNETHQQQDGCVAPEYICKPLTAFADDHSGSYDVVVCSEVLEHVSNPRAFTALCCQLVRPGGCVVFTTMNRTIYSLLVYMILVEDILGLIPRWLHRLYLCVKPEEIEQVTNRMGFETLKLKGVLWYPSKLSLSLHDNLKCALMNFTGLGYVLVAKRH